MAGTSEGGKKAAETRKEHDPQAFQKMGHAGGEARQSKNPEEKSGMTTKEAAQTRKEHDPEAFKKMGEKGGSHSHGGKKEESGKK